MLTINVKLPSVASIPLEKQGKDYTVKRLVSPGRSNMKLAKSDAINSQIKTFGLTLAPAKESGYQLCSSASAGCREACIWKQGMVRIWPEMIQTGRIAKAVAWKQKTDEFKEKLLKEVGDISRTAERRGYKAAIRPNVTSDVMWEKELPDLFSLFPNVIFYDYTKHFKRMLRFCNGEFPKNYYLTFSRSEVNDTEASEVLKAGGNVAVVFRDKVLPKTWKGFKVFNGDESDLRFLDPRPSRVIGLYAKGTAKKDKSGFVVNRRISLPVA